MLAKILFTVFNIGMRIMPINTYQTPKPGFKSCIRIYSSKSVKNNKCFGKDKIRTSTNLLREDIDWYGLAKFLKKHFESKENVNIYSMACSDGSEAYSVAIGLMENIPEKLWSKFLPVKASDIDSAVLNLAKGKRINIEPIEFFMAGKKYDCDLGKYFKDRSVSVMLTGDINSETDMLSSYHPIPELANAVNFHRSDILTEINKLEDEGNSVVMCRNVFPYLNETYIDAVLKSAQNKLKKGSLFIIGDYDAHANIDSKILEYGFNQPLSLKSKFINCENIFVRV